MMYFFGFMVILSAAQAYKENEGLLDSNSYYDDVDNSNSNYGNNYETSMKSIKPNFDQRDYLDEPIFPKSLREIKGIERIGCFEDQKQRALPHYVKLAPARFRLEYLSNVKRCRDMAKARGGHYFAVQHWRQCWYGAKRDWKTQPFKYGRKYCPNEFTGGVWSQMVYRLVEPGNLPISSLPGIPPTYVPGFGYL